MEEPGILVVADPPESWLWRRTRGSTTPNRTIPSGIPQNLTVRLHLDFGIILIWSRLMSRLCIGTRSQADCCANHGTQFFFILPVIPQARNRMQLPRRHASSASQVIVPAPRSGTNFCSQEEANQWPDSADHCRMRFGPQYARQTLS